MPKCPKCQYFSFDSGDRCRNCGYDFSLTADAGVPPDDLQMQDRNEPLGPLADLALHEPANNLPLFTPSADSDAPLVTPAATPRAPLSVRRGAPQPPRSPRQKRERTAAEPAPRLALDTAEIPVVAPRQEPEPPPTHPAEPPSHHAAGQIAGTIARLGAAIIDFGLLAGINVVVLYFTLKICDLSMGEIGQLPGAPLTSFLLLIDGGYLAAFVAAGGQTIGKMATRIRVVPADPAAQASERVTFGHAVVRSAAFFISLLPAGLGLLPALFGEHRGLHDRLADTRVVKA